MFSNHHFLFLTLYFIDVIDDDCSSIRKSVLIIHCFISIFVSIYLLIYHNQSLFMNNSQLIICFLQQIFIVDSSICSLDFRFLLTKYHSIILIMYIMYTQL